MSELLAPPPAVTTAQPAFDGRNVAAPLVLAQNYKQQTADLTLVAANQTTTYLNMLNGMDGRAINDGIRTDLVGLANTYGQLSIEQSNTFYSDLRLNSELSNNVHYNNYEPLAFESTPVQDELYSALGFAIREYAPEILVGAAEIVLSPEFLAFAGAAVGLAVANYGRNQIIRNTFKDIDAKQWVRIPRPDSCAWCKFNAVIIEDQQISVHNVAPAGFHKDCHCVLAVKFKDDPETIYRQSFFEPFENDVAKASSQIEDGYTNDFVHIVQNHDRPGVTTKNILSVLRNEYGYK